MAFVNGTQLANAMIGGLHDAGILAGTVWKDREYNGVAGKGDTVNVRKVGVDAAANFAGTTSATASAETVVPVVLNHQPYVRRDVTSAESALKVEDFYRQVVYPGVQGIAEYLEGEIADELATTTTTELTGASAKAAIIAAREAMSDAKVPLTDRFLACSPAFIAALLEESWIQADTFGDGGQALREAVVGRAFGFTILESTHVDDVDFDTGGVDPTAYAYHRSSLIMASRMPNPPQGGADYATAALDGYGARIVYDWSSTSLSDIVTIDTLAGFSLSDDDNQRIVQPIYL